MLHYVQTKIWNPHTNNPDIKILPIWGGLSSKNKHVKAITYVDAEVYPILSKIIWTLSGENYVGMKKTKDNVKLSGLDLSLLEDKQYRLHSFILGTVSGLKVQPLEITRNFCIDHIDGDTLDNRRINLRIASTQQNNFNKAKTTNCSTGFKGVSFIASEGYYRAQITFNNRNYYIAKSKYLQDVKKLAMMYDAVATVLFKDFAKVNFHDVFTFWKSTPHGLTKTPCEIKRFIGTVRDFYGN